MSIAERATRLQHQCRTMGLDFVFICSPGGVTYYTGYCCFSEHGPSPFHFLPAMLVTSPTLGSTLLLAGNEPLPDIDNSETVIRIFESYTYLEPLHCLDSFMAQLKTIIGLPSGKKIRIGIEMNYFPSSVSHVIEAFCKSVEWVDVEGMVSLQRSVKDADEIELIKASAGLCDLGQKTTVKNAVAGLSELELFARVKTSIEQFAGTRIVLMADFVAGARTAQGGGIPSSKKINDGDLLLADLTPCLQGYWGDCCNTYCLSSPRSDQKRDFQKIKAGLSGAIEKIKPGVKAKDIDKLLRSTVFDYPHHSGHGVGTMSHEEPRITPYNNDRLKAGMVIALEPAIYREHYGIRLEHLVLVTETGPEILTSFDHQFELV